MMNILEWGGKMQGTVRVRASMMVVDDGEGVDLWAGMRETTGSRAANGEPINEAVERVLDGGEAIMGGRERDGAEHRGRG